MLREISMYKYFLALGSNLGKTIENIDTAILKIQNIGCKIIKIAPFYKTAPLLPQNADESYNKMFCNTAIEIVCNYNHCELLKKTQQIEIEMGREKRHQYWAPRVIDIDILFCEKNGEIVSIQDETLIVPHKEIFNRSFVLDPLSQIAPGLAINNKKVLEERKKLKDLQSTIMAIVNITDNSFCGDGTLDRDAIKAKIQHLLQQRVAFIDIGAESTNPYAKPITWQEEVARLLTADVFDFVKNNHTNGVKFSIDTYHPETAEIAVKNGFNVINDVNGFKDEKMWEVMQKYPNIEAVIMHSLQPNGNKATTIDPNADIIFILAEWVKHIENLASQHNIVKDRIIIDYGIGFGKTAEQDLFIINNVEKIDNRGFRILIGHSNKSFMRLLGTNALEDRKLMTTKISNQLTIKGVDILRLHL